MSNTVNIDMGFIVNHNRLHSEIIIASKFILDNECVDLVYCKIKENMKQSYFSPRKNIILYGERAINSLLSDHSFIRYRLYFVNEHNQFVVYSPSQMKLLTAKERLASLILEEVAHAIAHNKFNYRGMHGNGFREVFVYLFRKYYRAVLGTLKSVIQYEIIGNEEAKRRLTLKKGHQEFENTLKNLVIV